MECAKIIAGYTLGGADMLRRAMGKKDAEAMAKERVKFVEARQAARHRRKTSERDLRPLNKFASYGFNKSHSAAYAVISYQTALSQGQLPGAVHGRRAHDRARQLRKGRPLHRRVRGDGPHRARTGRQREPRDLHPRLTAGGRLHRQPARSASDSPASRASGEAGRAEDHRGTREKRPVQADFADFIRPAWTPRRSTNACSSTS
jgi:hypothetical protein